jgi:IS30 family transposase
LEVTKGLIRLIKKHHLKIKTITSDNGTEFSLYKFFINKYNIKWYFADPYKSGQRGQNERLNRDLRKFLNKGSTFEHVSPEKLENYVNKINDLPRKKFNGLSAIEFHSKIYDTIN